MKTRLLTIILLALAVPLLISSCKKKPSAQEQIPAKQQKQTIADVNQMPPKTDTAPDFTLENYEGNSVSLSDYKSKIVVLEWFNYDCPFSKYHHEKEQTMTNLAEKFKDQGVVWLAINSTDYMTAEKNKEFALKNNIPYPILTDKDGTVAKLYDAKTTPHMFIINKNQEIVYNGGIDDSPMGEKGEKGVNFVDQALGELLDEKAISQPKTKPYGCSVKYAQ
ncbi:MAG: thioredoxin family protein [Planctomycetes bacterium]|nr:thioredoxin family protein [Planctomycetota bacterium]